MKVRKAKMKDKKETIKILMQMQRLHLKNRKDIFRKTTRKEIENEFIETIESNEKEMIVAINNDNQVCGLSYF